MRLEPLEDVVFELGYILWSIIEIVKPILLFTGRVVLFRFHFRNDVLLNELLSNIIEGDVHLQRRKEDGHKVIHLVFGYKIAELLEEGIPFVIQTRFSEFICLGVTRFGWRIFDCFVWRRQRRTLT